jgi:hypothetical protein
MHVWPWAEIKQTSSPRRATGEEGGRGGDRERGDRERGEIEREEKERQR